MLASALTMVVGQRLARRVMSAEKKAASSMMNTKITTFLEQLPESLRHGLLYD
jgi:type II secretory ATPase GspE/PulE/Tfp pilus assembly ATPase PilB-like protein